LKIGLTLKLALELPLNLYIVGQSWVESSQDKNAFMNEMNDKNQTSMAINKLWYDS